MLLSGLLILLLSLRSTRADTASEDTQGSAVASPLVYSPVVLSQLCQDSSNYCIYVDQVRPGAVQASPINATDNQGGFLIDRSQYLASPFRVCYGGCCIALNFAIKPGCVSMRYYNRGEDESSGHLLARFADTYQFTVGPRDFMKKWLQACSKDGEPLPYVVIAARDKPRRRLATHPPALMLAAETVSKMQINAGQAKQDEQMPEGADGSEPVIDPKADMLAPL
ncbi:hypothetical protein PSEUBRA_005859 [Kalmanozyma brasiliensis GHG001]|nr:uncharacterized protein PSEUBRA_005859 [Kalmanozyma brasiliensis GHG001]EST05051.2 hypothetical protein PSEUBRA_005859 [Kalmanozyma brasiliensis GHG001]